MPAYRFENKIPKIAKTSYVHPQTAIIGDVEIVDDCAGKPCSVPAPVGRQGRQGWRASQFGMGPSRDQKQVRRFK
jgi:hypothetical protein